MRNATSEYDFEKNLVLFPLLNAKITREKINSINDVT